MLAVSSVGAQREAAHGGDAKAGDDERLVDDDVFAGVGDAWGEVSGLAGADQLRA